MLPRKTKADAVTCFVRPLPSANFALIHGPRPILVDSGFGSDAEDTLRLVEDAGAHPRDLRFVANTHYHADHTGGNAAFQREGARIAAHRHDAMMINHADPHACASAWLDQPLEQYRVDVYLQHGMVLETGTVQVIVLGTPGHTLGHLSFLVEDGTLIAGDTFHDNDVAWLNPFREGSGALYRLVDSLHMLAEPPIPIKRAISGHGPLINKPYEAIDRALERLDRWLDDLEKPAWHACKRIAANYPMLTGPLSREAFDQWLRNSHWLNDYAKHVFRSDVADVARQLYAELLRSGAVEERDGLVRATAPHTPVSPAWLASVPPTTTWQAQA